MAFQKILNEVQFKSKVWMSILDDVLKDDDFKIYSYGDKKLFKLSQIGFVDYKKPAHPADLGVSNLKTLDEAGRNTSNSLDLVSNSENRDLGSDTP